MNEIINANTHSIKIWTNKQLNYGVLNAKHPIFQFQEGNTQDFCDVQDACVKISGQETTFSGKRKDLSECWPRHVYEMNAAIRRIISPETFCFPLFLHRQLQKTQTRHFCVCFELILLLFAVDLPHLWNQKRFECNISISFYSKLIVERTKMLSTQLESDRFHSFDLLLCNFGSEFIPFHFHFQQNHGWKTEIMGEIEPNPFIYRSKRKKQTKFFMIFIKSIFQILASWTFHCVLALFGPLHCFPVDFQFNISSFSCWFVIFPRESDFWDPFFPWFLSEFWVRR